QSNRERSIADALRRKIKIEGLDDLFGDVIVPTEKVTEFKGGKKKVVERKLYPGYIVVHMHINDDTWFAVRETSGIGDFTGSGGKPTPMLPHEVTRIIHTEEEETDEAPKLDIKFKLEDKVKVKDGTFEGFEGEVSAIDEQSGKITVMLSIFGRSTPVELEYWQVEGV
ncbi:MAG: transcription termination/antitermination factor NusG, partial [Planctomycetales bacterium]|nr:transcription termination/antitermination factor NusG [Planctomycetales bacterium]